ncbi:F0F1 ATP synthase subunit epsilon [Emcibacter nanhaiensis]|uniref:F0F1 ATP synthase subunit epsilon n=1 Tax=Emcibacter nanhaiensis TaxID=1505037 RepID=A0A501PHE4_9PROT|nr:F0F1 ATP synthase subunit epsilon [Emcibacter nanhaiensis]TPD59839.1 F0F1 ATP synthase subunit epsilon [Emcibacter nanhaiensis]
MSGFTLHLQSGGQVENLENVTSFSAADASGSFGLKAGHERFMTVLESGLARYRQSAGRWRYLALSGGILYFIDNELFLCTHRYVRSENYQEVTAAISEILAEEEETRKDLKTSISRMEQEMARRLWDLQRERV